MLESGLDEQLSIKAKGVLANLFIRYIANNEDKTEILDKERKTYYEEELLKSQNTKLNVMFERKNKKTNLETNKALVVYNEERFLNKILNKIKAFLKRRRHNLWK